jgi:hypothetical protein
MVPRENGVVMSKSRIPAPTVKTTLIIPQDIAKERIRQQLEKGNEIAIGTIRSEEDLKRAKAQYRIWRDYTRELLAQISNTETIANEFVGAAVLISASWGGLPFPKEVSSFQYDINKHIERLSSIYERIELYPYSPVKKVIDDEQGNQPGNFSGNAILNYGVINNPQIQQGINSSQEILNAQQNLDTLLAQLTESVEKIYDVLSPESKPQAKQDLSVLVTEAQSKLPRRQWYQLTADGLIKAAKNVGEIGKPVIDIVGRILVLLANKPQ